MKKLRIKFYLKGLIRAWQKNDIDKSNIIMSKIENIIRFSQSEYDIIFCGTGEQIIDLIKSKTKSKI